MTAPPGTSPPASWVGSGAKGNLHIKYQQNFNSTDLVRLGAVVMKTLDSDSGSGHDLGI